MKKITLLLLITMVFIGCNQQDNADKNTINNTNVEAVTAIKSIQLNVTGMTCEGCENTVQDRLINIDGVISAQASYKSELAMVSFDSTKVSKEVIAEAINSLGYKVEN